MVVSKGINLMRLLRWTGPHIVWLLAFMGSVAFLYHNNHIVFTIPWVAVTVIGTAVAFYVGFKNNQAYDRMWEARKIWGAIVNSSRAWGMYIDGFISNLFTDEKRSDQDLKKIKTRLIYRHIAWLYSLRSQLLVAAPWEHASQDGHIGKTAKYYQKYFGVGLIDDQITRDELAHYLPPEEHESLINKVNTATQIINEQSRNIRELREEGVIDDFRHMQLERLLYHFYEHQGKCERIKKFPFPRQYANMSRFFVGIFILILPFSLIPEMMTLGDWGIWASIPIAALTCWVYLMMELVGDYSENPFQGMANDIPMLSLCRTIEIDLLEMLGEKELPEPIKAKNDILM